MNQNHKTVIARRMSSYRGGSEELFWRLHKEQEGRCAICRIRPFEILDFHIDHNHENNTIRGLLCSNCNHGLGNFKDCPEIVTDALAYLVERGHDSQRRHWNKERPQLPIVSAGRRSRTP